MPLLVLGFFSNAVSAQVGQAPVIKKSKLFGVAHSTKKEILIRWAPSDEAMWKDANRYGYAVERYTVLKDGKMLENFERTKTRLVIKPKPVSQWDTLMQKDDYAAVLAQAIYGDDFDVEMSDDKGDLTRIINETEKLKQRYNMSMYAVDHSFDAAVFGGLGWKDTNVKPNDRYFYRIYSLIPKELRKTDTALLYIGLSDYKPLPKPSDILAEFGDKSVMLKWDFESYAEHYTSFMIERSEDDGKTFKPVSDKPITSLNEKAEESPVGSMFYIDTLADNNTEYQYRIAGVSLFGETGPYSKIVKGRGKTILALNPNIKNVTIDNGEYKLNWDFDDSLSSQVREFRINHAEKIEGPYKVIRRNIDATGRSIAIDSLAASNYYTVTAISYEGEERSSMPYLMQPEDSVPPGIPVGLRATVDSNGVVEISWNANMEKDISGYRILKTNVKGQELVPLFDSLWRHNKVTDTVNLKSLNSKIYYTVIAVDNRYNQSGLAPMIEIRIPDIIPPTQPVLIDYEISDHGVSVNWINSSDDDVAFHTVYRKQIDGTNGWQMLHTSNSKDEQKFTDTNYEAGKTYSYTVVATDSSRLESAPAIPLTINIPAKHNKEAISKLIVEVDRKNRVIAINWELKKEAKSIRQFEIYRGWDKQPMSLYQQVDMNQQKFTDKELLINTRYKYAVRAVYTDGGYSDFVVKNVIY